MSGFAVVTVLVAALASSPAVAPTLDAIFAAGVEAYDAQDYDAAITEFDKLVAFGAATAAVEFNLGNAHFKRQDYGHAVLHWERARKLAPGDAEARENLELVRALLVDEVPADASPLAAVLARIRAYVDADQLTAAVLAAWLTAGIGLVVVLLAPRARRGAAIVVAIAAAVVVVAGPVAWLQHRALADQSRYVVLAPVVEVRSGPGEQYTAVFAVHEGLVVKSRDSSSGWERVRLPNGLDGWVPSDAVERI